MALFLSFVSNFGVPEKLSKDNDTYDFFQAENETSQHNDGPTPETVLDPSGRGVGGKASYLCPEKKPGVWSGPVTRQV